jgi:hypothetical protein
VGGDGGVTLRADPAAPTSEPAALDALRALCEAAWRADLGGSGGVRVGAVDERAAATLRELDLA